MKLSTVRTFFIFFICTFALLKAQSSGKNMLIGKVYDAATSESLSNASVYLSGTTIGTATDKNGYYQIAKVPAGKYQLIISLVGYAPLIERINLPDSSIHKKDFHLEQQIIEMNPVQISEEHTEEWKENLEAFKKYFLGQTDFSDECTIENQNEIVLLKDTNNVLTAKSTNPLTVINRALGYRIECLLAKFVLNEQKLQASIVYYAKFSELESSNKNELNHWDENREDAFENSLKKFLHSIIDSKNIKREYFINTDKLYNLYKSGRYSYSVVSLDSTFWKKHITQKENEKTFVVELDKRLYGVLNLRTREESYFRLPEGSLEIDTDGTPIDPLMIDVSGDYANKGVANLLPKDYSVFNLDK